MHSDVRILLFTIALFMIIASLGSASRKTEDASLLNARFHNASLPPQERALDLLSHMTLDEKIGQMALVEKNSVPHVEVVSRFGLGALLSGGGGKPSENTPLGWRTMITAFQDASRRSRTGIPILYGIDANHGHGNVPGATIFPHAIGLGAAGDEELAEKIAHATGEEVRATGADWIFSPSLDLPTDIRWGRVYEAFSEHATIAGPLGAAQVRGFHSAGALATPKHYLGAGSMIWGSSSNPRFLIDQGVTPRDELALRTAYLPPFEDAIASGAKSIMVGLNAWGDEKMSANRYLVTDLLKGELAFDGFVVSDWYGVYEISESKYDSAVAAINAGIDMVMLPYEYEQFIRDVRNAVLSGAIPEERIDDAVLRILRVKFERGLFETRTLPGLETIGSREHRALARDAVARSAVILKNDAVLPIDDSTRTIRVAGSAADNVGLQSGAWTVEWQGIDGNWLPGATSILSGIRASVGAREVQYSADGVFDGDERADVGIAIVGERPYAEGWGDTAHPQISDDDLSAITRLKESTDKLLVIIVSGRPLIITDELAEWDALIAAWLPGSEGAGIADVLFSATTTGKLPLTWPRTIDQLPLTHEGASSDSSFPLFPRGFGLQLVAP